MQNSIKPNHVWVGFRVITLGTKPLQSSRDMLTYLYFTYVLSSNVKDLGFKEFLTIGANIISYVRRYLKYQVFILILISFANIYSFI